MTNHTRTPSRTTIVGGRPPDDETPPRTTPRGIEVLLKKASIDPPFAALLVEQRARAAESIDLTLEPSERRMLETIPEQHLRRLIERTHVAPLSRAAFLGQAAAVMFAALGADAAYGGVSRGIRPDFPDSRGIRPDFIDGIRPDPFPPEPAPDDGPSPYVAYGRTSWNGDVEFGIADDETYRDLATRVDVENTAVARACEKARAAWAERSPHGALPFPLDDPPLSTLSKRGSFHDGSAARDAAARWRSIDEKRRRARERQEHRRIEGLPAEERAQAELREAARHDALRLIEEFLGGTRHDIKSRPLRPRPAEESFE